MNSIQHGERQGKLNVSNNLHHAGNGSGNVLGYFGASI